MKTRQMKSQQNLHLNVELVSRFTVATFATTPCCIIMQAIAVKEVSIKLQRFGKNKLPKTSMDENAMSDEIGDTLCT